MFFLQFLLSLSLFRAFFSVFFYRLFAGDVCFSIFRIYFYIDLFSGCQLENPSKPITLLDLMRISPCPLYSFDATSIFFLTTLYRSVHTLFRFQFHFEFFYTFLYFHSYSHFYSRNSKPPQNFYLKCFPCTSLPFASVYNSPTLLIFTFMFIYWNFMSKSSNNVAEIASNSSKSLWKTIENDGNCWMLPNANQPQKRRMIVLWIEKPWGDAQYRIVVHWHVCAFRIL